MRSLVILAVLAATVAAGCAGISEARVQPETVAGPDVRGADWFRQTGCAACHSISAYDVWNATAIGPDLSLAVEDVPKRFGVPLEEFLHSPSGTMAMVLSTRIPLTADQRNLAILRLKEAYRVHQEKTGARAVPSH